MLQVIIYNQDGSLFRSGREENGEMVAWLLLAAYDENLGEQVFVDPISRIEVEVEHNPRILFA